MRYCIDMNKRQYDQTIARLNVQLETARAAELTLSETFNKRGAPCPIEPALGDAWNAMHDAISALEAELRYVELEGYGRNSRSYRAAHSNGLADLVARNID